MTISRTSIERLQSVPVEPPDPHGPIIRVESDRLLEAIVRLLAVGGEPDPVRAERFIAFSQSNSIRLDCLWSRLDGGGRIVQSVLAVPSAGRTAMFFSSRPQRKRDVPAVAGLIDHACTAVANEDVVLAQALLDPSEFVEREVYRAGGFEVLARLSYLERPLPRKPGKRPIVWPEGVSIEPYRDEVEDDLLTILDASYEDTLDCPGLRGMREKRDILAGHRGTGAFEPDLWTIMRIGGRPAGALLLNPSPHQKNVELVYIGLSKFARGRGLGTLLLRHGLRLVAGRKERMISLAVDERNAPALGLYHAEGFRKALRRIALVRRTGRASAASRDGAES